MKKLYLIFMLVFAFINSSYSKKIAIGHLVDFTGPTSSTGQPFGKGAIDAINYINKNNGILGQKIKLETFDYSYKAPRAVVTYKRWRSKLKAPVIIGWGTADTEALMETIARDKIAFFSGSYAGQLTDPTGLAPNSFKAAPYNFFYGPSYSDACRGLLSWAMKDWKSKNNKRKPNFVHMGDNHPYPNAPKQACSEYADELGFNILPVVNYTLVPSDFTAQCLTLKEMEADYAYLANSSNSTTSILKACNTVGVKTQFMANVWGIDETVIKASNKASDGLVFAVRTESIWGEESEGMELIKEISMSADENINYRSLHYITAICMVYYIAEAIQMAIEDNNLSGEGIKLAMYKKKNWVPKGLKGICLPSTWTNEDHRGIMDVPIYRVNVTSSTEKLSVEELMNNNIIKLNKIDQITLPRRMEWRGY